MLRQPRSLPQSCLVESWRVTRFEHRRRATIGGLRNGCGKRGSQHCPDRSDRGNGSIQELLVILEIYVFCSQLSEVALTRNLAPLVGSGVVITMAPPRCATQASQGLPPEYYNDRPT
jgi:hypothetical protein